MRTCGHREGNITQWSVLGVGGVMGGIELREISNVDDWLMGVANHHGRCIPMYKSYMFCTCIPELKV